MPEEAQGKTQESEAICEADDTVRVVHELFASRGAAWYGGEAVSQLQHGLQAAMFAEQENAPAELVVAALLHDVGHLLHELPEEAAELGLDDCHETLGMDWLRARFSARVYQPVGLHVAAKRFLCGTEPDYLEQLSPASRQSLTLQGGPMSTEQARRFSQGKFHQDAVRLRKWDDAAKVVELRTPPLGHFDSHLLEAALGSPS